MRLEVKCPLCGEGVSVSALIVPRFQLQGKTKIFVTAEVSVGGMEHTCMGLPENMKGAMKSYPTEEVVRGEIEKMQAEARKSNRNWR